MDETRELVELSGILDVSTELCIDGSEALALVTDDGDEFVINNRKTVKRLMKYAYSMSRLSCTGYLEHDPTGIEVLTLISFVEEPDEPEAAPEAPSPKKVEEPKGAARKSAEKKAAAKKTSEGKASEANSAAKKASAKTPAAKKASDRKLAPIVFDAPSKSSSSKTAKPSAKPSAKKVSRQKASSRMIADDILDDIEDSLDELDDSMFVDIDDLDDELGEDNE